MHIKLCDTDTAGVQPRP